jgi:hypothetical protein
MKRTVLAAAVGALLVGGCASPDPATTAGPPDPVGSARSQADPAQFDPAMALLRKYGVTGRDSVEVVDNLDRLAGAGRPSELIASVRPDELQLSAGSRTASLPIPEDRFYLSVAPYIEHTHDCFYHSLTTCQGELGGKEIAVRIVDAATGEVLVDGDRTTFANGFVGFWLPRDITGRIEVEYDGRAGRAAISTGADAPTCLTSLRLT